MNSDIEVIDDDHANDSENELDRRELLEPIITRVVDALGGLEAGVYRMGDEAYSCLKDLKRLWRKDDTDDDRTVARIFWESRVLTNDLIPILLATAGKGLVEDKRAIICADLITAMTWPIDIAAELKELDEVLDSGTDYTQLLQSHLHYKAALLKPGVMQALLGIMLPPLAKPRQERKDRDGQVVNVVLHLIRNLAFIKDLPPNIHMSSDHLEYSSLQSRLIRVLSESQIMDLLLTIATNSEKDPLLNSWNTVVLETLYLLFRGIKPETLVADRDQRPQKRLQSLLAQENQLRKDVTRNSASRHSRFGTTVSVKLKKSTDADDDAPNSSADQPILIHRQQGVKGETGAIMDMKKKQKAKKVKTADELGRDDRLSVEARGIISNLATDFIKSAFNPFLASLLKDIKSERPHITEKDHLRLLYVTKWLLEFFTLTRAKLSQSGNGLEQWGFGLVVEVTERGWIIWVLKRMRGATEEKPKLWVELQAGIECLTQLILLIDAMSMVEITDASLREAADLLQQQLIYNGDVLDLAFDSLKTYKEATHSLAYLDASVYLAYSLMRMLERWGKGSSTGEMYVRQKVKKRRKKINEPDEATMNEEEEIANSEDENFISEIMFTFEAFEMRFAQSDVTETLLTYLARYREYEGSHEKLKRVVSLLHRQAVKSKAEGLFFKVSTLDLFKSILADQKSFPNEQPYKDLVNLIRYILRQFFKQLEKEPLLAVEAFFPKNRSHWKQYSSWEPEEKPSKTPRSKEERKPGDVAVKGDFTLSEKIGISVAALVEADQTDLVQWTKEILETAVGLRRRVSDDIEGAENDEHMDRTQAQDGSHEAALRTPNYADYVIPYTSDEQAKAAAKNARLKLLFQLSNFGVRDDDLDELAWYIPAKLPIAELENTAALIRQFLEKPLELDGKKASELLQKKRRPRRRRVRDNSQESGDDSETELRKKARKEKKKKEEKTYKSAQTIEDSDVEEGLEEFLAKEKALREKAMRMAADGVRMVGTMKAQGTKKRRRPVDGEGGGKKRRRKDEGEEETRSSDSGGEGGMSDSEREREGIRVTGIGRRKNRVIASDESE